MHFYSVNERAFPWTLDKKAVCVFSIVFLLFFFFNLALASPPPASSTMVPLSLFSAYLLKCGSHLSTMSYIEMYKYCAEQIMGNKLDFNNMHASKKFQLNSWENPNLFSRQIKQFLQPHFAVNV